MAAPHTIPTSTVAAVATGPYATELRTLSLPPVGPDDGLLRVEAAAICGTDWEIYGRESRGSGLGPLILGHEIVGRVAALGEQAALRWDVAVGDRVAVEEFLPCGSCRHCRTGSYRLCPATDSRGELPFLRYGSTPLAVPPALYGGFSQYLYLHPRAVLYPVGDDLEPELATLFVPVANGVRWVLADGGLGLGQTVVVLGPGQHGLGCVLAARAAGAGRIIVVGTARDRHRLEVAGALGADHLLTVDEGMPAGVLPAVRELTGGAGADLVVDLVPGTPGTVAVAVAMAGTGGTVVLAGSKHGQLVSVPYERVVAKELRLVGVRGHDNRSVPTAIELIRSQRQALRVLASHRFPVARTADALWLAGKRSDPTAIHVSVVP